MSTIPAAWDREDAWCDGCRCLVELCECPSEEERLEKQLEASLDALENGAVVVSRFELPKEQDLAAVHAQLARGVGEKFPRRQGEVPEAKRAEGE
jgi:hypothetical protein